MDSRTIDIIAPDKLKDVLITRTAIRTFKSEDVVEKVISHQFKEVRDGFKKYAEIEISGFGKFFLSQHKIIKKITRYEKILHNLEAIPDRNMEIEEKIRSISEEIVYLKSKLKNESGL